VPEVAEHRIKSMPLGKLMKIAPRATRSSGPISPAALGMTRKTFGCAASSRAMVRKSSISLTAKARQASTTHQGSHIMDKDRIAGSVKQAVGGIKQGVGNLLGDKKAQAEGVAEQVEGKLQNTVGEIRDAGRETINKT
jgi:uncharacterized protein YjbJ (UPF0337 family)